MLGRTRGSPQDISQIKSTGRIELRPQLPLNHHSVRVVSVDRRDAELSVALATPTGSAVVVFNTIANVL